MHKEVYSIGRKTESSGGHNEHSRRATCFQAQYEAVTLEEGNIQHEEWEGEMFDQQSQAYPTHQSPFSDWMKGIRSGLIVIEKSLFSACN